jgi:hypothetical protein
MANVLLDILRSMAVGAAADKAREEAAPIMNDVLMSMAAPQEAVTPGARMIDGYPSMSSGLEAITAPYQPNRGFTAEAADPSVVQQMVQDAYNEQMLRQSEVDADVAAENAANAANVQDFVRQASVSPIADLPDEGELMKQLDPRKMEAAGISPQRGYELSQAAGTLNLVPEVDRIARETGDDSIFDSFNKRLKNVFDNEENFYSMVLAFNTLRYKPDSGIAAIAGKRLESASAQKKANKTAAALRAKGTPSAIKAAEYIESGGKVADAMKIYYGTQEYGLTPQTIVNDKGERKLIQISKTGEIKEVDLPEGYRPAPTIQKVDTGTGTALVDKSGNQVGFIPKDIKGEITEKFTAEQVAAAPQNYQNSKNQLNVVNQLIDHPAFDNLFGAVEGRLPSVRQETLDAEAILNQIRGTAFLAAFSSLKGGGQISNVEGQKAEQAIARLQTTQSEEAARNSLQELATILRNAMAKARSMDPNVGKEDVVESPAGTPSAPSEAPVLKYNPATGKLE